MASSSSSSSSLSTSASASSTSVSSTPSTFSTPIIGRATGEYGRNSVLDTLIHLQKKRKVWRLQDDKTEKRVCAHCGSSDLAPESKIVTVSNGACYSTIDLRNKIPASERRFLADFSKSRSLISFTLANRFCCVVAVKSLQSRKIPDCVLEDIGMAAAQYTADPSFVAGYDSDGNDK